MGWHPCASKFSILDMVLYAVLFAFITTGALPLRPSGVNVTFEHELTVRADGCTPSSRTVLGIVWGCLTTIFACTWLAIHPNVPSPDDSRWRILLRRAMIMALAIVFPEYTTVWAIRQWQEAKRISREMASREEFPEWTITHSFFIMMGGFMLMDEAGEARGPLLIDQLLYFKKNFRDFKFPSISEREIQDRSKGDALSKALIFLHTSWFLLQVLARPISGLPVTELELVMVAVASLNILAYGFWFKKPLNVECPVKVVLPSWILSHPPSPTTSSFHVDTESREPMAEPRALDIGTFDFEEGSRPNSPWMVFNRSQSEVSLPLATNPFSQVQHSATFIPPFDSQERLPWPSGFGPPVSNAGVVQSQNFPFSPDTSLEILSMDITDAFELVESRPCTPSGSTNSMRLNSQLSAPNPLSQLGVQRVTAFTQDLTRRANFSRRITRTHLHFSFSTFTSPPIRRVQHVIALTRNLMQRVTLTMITTHLRRSPLPMAFMREAFRPGSKHRESGVGAEIDTSPYGLRVPTFYSGSKRVYSLESTSGILQLLMAMYFGGLHCVAWNFVFPTRELCQLWRISAITLTSIPLHYLIYMLGIQAYHEHKFPFAEWKELPSSVRRVFYYSGISLTVHTYRKFGCFAGLLHRLLIFLYLAARITLIILPFILLQGYPSHTLEEVEWTKYIPHVSWILSP
ncbi:hypothetical protein E1B28_013558 [Marasmius oreades]|uniref:Uncharacterized protein n=1 Tax=Marasmius oreades TaxID=181124 RepID=A0A9P7RQ17_9AGAR|nr:uncharacterized protein E1B28_013558 [Marasmius oreades]KAG7087609.1 hypothetical protein E1B28_013558 [Marasmius oreades]